MKPAADITEAREGFPSTGPRATVLLRVSPGWTIPVAVSSSQSIHIYPRCEKRRPGQSPGLTQVARLLGAYQSWCTSAPSVSLLAYGTVAARYDEPRGRTPARRFQRLYREQQSGALRPHERVPRTAQPGGTGARVTSLPRADRSRRESDGRSGQSGNQQAVLLAVPVTGPSLASALLWEMPQGRPV
jgi:hypothetical protein